MQSMEMYSLLLKNFQIMASYLDKGWNIIGLVNELLLILESVILQTLHCGRSGNPNQLPHSCCF